MDMKSTCFSLPVENCSKDGECQGHFAAPPAASSSENQCLVQCKETSGCQFYTFDPANGLCLFYEDCASLNVACADCLSGEVTCPFRSKLR